MKIQRDGCHLSITIDTGIGYNMTFRRSESCDADAEAWRVHCQNEQYRLAREDQAAKDRSYRRNMDLAEKNDALAKSNAALRGVITKMKKRGQP